MSRNTTPTVFSICRSTLFYEIVFVYLVRIIEISTIMTSLISVIIFRKIIKNEPSGRGQMFKYYMVESIFELLLFLVIVFEVGYHCKGCGRSYEWKVWYVWFYIYSYYAIVTMCSYLEVAAQFDCYIMINNKLKWCQTKKFFISILIFLILFGFIPNSQMIFVFNIIEIKQNFTEKRIFFVGISDYYFTDLYNILSYTLTIIREIVPLILLLILNTLVLRTLRKVVKRKRVLLQRSINNNTSTITANENIRNGSRIANDAEINKLKMILFISLDYLILKTPLAINLLPFRQTPKFINNIYWHCYFFQSAYTLYFFSYFLKFFIYYHFNKKYREYFNSVFKLTSRQ
jgi:hypothetical protein